MTIPIWAPFAVLAGMCAVCPPPAWMRRLYYSVEWVAVGAALWVAGSWAVFIWWLA